MGNVFVVGLAGGIGSGKSTVAGMLRKLGASVLDADAMVHELLRQDRIIRKVVRRFGKEVLDSRGGIDRGKLAKAAFASRRNIRDLEGILHPPVIDAVKRRTQALRRSKRRCVVVIDAPLLFEAGLDRLCDEIVFVHVPKHERLRRLRKMRGWSRERLKRSEKHQKTLDYKRKNADRVIRNVSRSGAREQVRSYWRHVRHHLSK